MEDIEQNTDVIDVATQSTLDTVLMLWAEFFSHVPYVLGSVFILLVTWGLSALLGNVGTRLLSHWRKRRSVKELILRLLSLMIWILGLLLAAIVLFPGLTPSKALGGLGLVSIAVGLAFKDIFENFFAGVLILWRFPFEDGDYIECEELVGRIEKIWVRMSYIRKTSGELVVVPNSFLFKNPVTVLTSQPHRRIIIMTGVAYDVDVASAVDVIFNAVNDCSSVQADRKVQVFPKAFGSSSIDIEVAWWTGSTPVELRESRAEVVTAIKSALDKAGMEIPFPYRTLTFKEPLSLKSTEDQQSRDIDDFK